ncbi:uncharacterized protein LOC110845469 [Folsomia candida]|uniref:Uncharacterized protein n=1 Tax=Folsomia candida TaxID=158441 RepID=A0A226EMA5_FOLCA|nr:uncharacterized protein LOC110845469 [Folsomia candida]OXA57686.1 hypothetical protein Fcan01_07624 [Folsomia candida]
MKDEKLPTYTFDKVSDWFDTDSFKVFVKVVNSGDVLELRSTKCSHWGVTTRIPQPPISPKSKAKPPKPVPDEIMVFHLIHSSSNRGMVGQFTLEEFWAPDCRIRINNSNISNLYCASRLVSKADVLQNAFTAHASTTLKWQTCADFIRWSSCLESNDDLRSGNSTANHSSSSITSSACSTASH